MNKVTCLPQGGATPLATPQTEKVVNTAMAVMECIGIVAVVLGHGSSTLKSRYLIYAWHMPFFMFISGYFFGRTSHLQEGCLQFIRRKTRSLLLPAVFANLLCGIVSMAIKGFGVAKYGRVITLKALLLTPFTSGYQFRINVSLWFIFTLFLLECLSAVIDRCAKGRADTVMLALFGILGVVCCYIAFNDLTVIEDELRYTLLRNIYLLFFFWLGICYKRHYEERLRRYLTPGLSCLLLLLLLLFIKGTGATITYNVRNMDLSDLTFFWTPAVTPIIVLAICLGFCYRLAPLVDKRGALVSLALNTRFVVYYHQMCFLLISFGLGMLIKYTGAFGTLSDFSYETMRTGQYYTGGKGNSFLVCIASMLIPFFVCRQIAKVKNLALRIVIYFALTGVIVLYLYLVSVILPAA